MKKVAILYLTISLFSKAVAQELPQTVAQSSFNFLGGVGLAHEHPISRQNTLYFKATLTGSFAYTDNLGSIFNSGINATMQVRHFYNFQRRIDSKKSVANNMGSFFALHVEGQDGSLLYAHPSMPVRRSVCGGPVWGVQLAKNRLLFNGYVGVVGYFPEAVKMGTTPISTTFNSVIQPIFRGSVGILIGKNAPKK